jgi:hypothetical protein
MKGISAEDMAFPENGLSGFTVNNRKVVIIAL